MTLHVGTIKALAVDDTVLDGFGAEMEGEPFPDEAFVVEGSDIVGEVRGIMISENIIVQVVDDNYLSVDGSGDIGGSAKLLWDRAGESFDPPDYEGLGVNLTEDDLGDGLDAILLRLNGVTNSGTITITIYSDEENGSQFTLSPVVSSSPVDFIIPFSSFSPFLGDGATFSSVGAIYMELANGLVAEIDQFEVTKVFSGITKTDALLTDANSNGLVEPNDIVRYTITIPANAVVPATFSDTLDENSTLVVGSVTTTSGTIVTGNTAGDSNVEVDAGTLSVGSPILITFDVAVNDPFPTELDRICNQGSISSSGLVTAMTDDPDIDDVPQDLTCTSIFVDREDPIFTNVPGDLSINSGDSTEPADTGGYATATDNVTANPTIDYIDTTIYGPGPYQQRINRNWMATDEAGNSANQTQVITINDIVDRSLSIDQSMYGLFQPSSMAGNRQLGTLELNGDITMVGSASSIHDGQIITPSGVTAYNMSDGVFYFIGNTTSDGLSKLFSVDLSTGVGSAQELSFGTESTVVGIWYDDVADTLFGLFQVGTGLLDRQLAQINTTNGNVSFLTGSISAPISTVGGIVAGSSSQNAFYFLGSAAGLPGSIYTINTTTGVATAALLSGANYNAIASIEYDEYENQLYALIFESGERRLASINVETGMVTPIGSTTIAGGGVQIATYAGVSTLDPFSDQFVFIGRYNPGGGNVWSLFAVDTTNGETTYNTIDTTNINSGNYYGLENDLTIGKLEVVKELTPDTDPGLFSLQIDGATLAGDITNGGTTGELVVNTGSYSIGEIAGTNTDLSDYISTVECKDDNGTGDVVASGSIPLDVIVATDDDIICVITNTRIDSDGDGIDDSWEIFYFGNLDTADEKSDNEGDGYSDLQEFLNDKAGEQDPNGNDYNPTIWNAPGGTGYVDTGFWLLMTPALIGNNPNQ